MREVWESGREGERERDVKTGERENERAGEVRETKTVILHHCQSAVKHNTLLQGTHHSLSFTLTQRCVCVCVYEKGGGLCWDCVDTCTNPEGLLIPDLHVTTRAPSLTSQHLNFHIQRGTKDKKTNRPPPQFSVGLSRVQKNIHSGMSCSKQTCSSVVTVLIYCCTTEEKKLTT